MLNSFTSFISSQGLFSPEDQVLLAVSGGLDSVVMTELFRLARYRFGIIHCNFQLRGTESDLDEELVDDLAKKIGVPCFHRVFQTEAYARDHRMSIQVAARELRYTWFEEVRVREGFQWIATAHHLDDQIETFLIHLLRGTGIAGLQGIPAINGRIIRPLLFARREELEAFCRLHQLSYREDSSNRSDAYTRNRIRHQLIPLLKELDPDYAGKVSATMRHIRNEASLLDAVTHQTRSRLFLPDQDGFRLPISEIRQLEPLEAWLETLLFPYRFHEETLRELVKALDHTPGKQFLSPTHRIIKDREHLILSPRHDISPDPEPVTFRIEGPEVNLKYPVIISISLVNRMKDDFIDPSGNIATLDAAKISFPMIVRRWRAGDSFYPLGLNHRKKVSDFLIDHKISLVEKERIWVLCCGNAIVWVIGYRIDHRFRVTRNTSARMVITFTP